MAKWWVCREADFETNMATRLEKKHKKAPPFPRERENYEKVKLLKILYILPTEKGKVKGTGLYLSKERSLKTLSHY